MKPIRFDDNITIRSLKKSDWDDISQLCDRRLGRGYLDYEDFLNRTMYPDINLVADDGGKAVAIVSFVPGSAEELAEKFQVDPRKLEKDAGGREILHYRTVLCDEEHEHTGLTSAVMEKVLENAKQRQCGAVYGTVWKYNGKLPAMNMLARQGFKKVKELHEPWLNQKGYECIVCKGPCRCDGVLIEKIF